MRLRFCFFILVLAFISSVSDAQMARKRSAASQPPAQPSPPVYQAPQPQQTCYVQVEMSNWSGFHYSSVSAAEAQEWIQGCQAVP